MSRITVERLELLEALKAVAPALPSRPLNPVLNGFYLETGGGLVIRATDETLSIMVRVHECEFDESARFVVSGKSFMEWVSKFKGNGRMTLHYDGTKLTALYGGSRCDFATINADEYPTGNNLDWEVASVAADSGVLSDALMRVAFAVDTTNTKPILSGVNISALEEASRVTFAALDGYRLATHTIWVQHNDDRKIANVTIPAAAAKTIASMAAASGGETILTVNKSSVAAWINGVFIRTRLLKGDYPDYKKLFPDINGAGYIEVNREDLIDALTRASIAVNGETNKLLRLSVEEGGELLRISANGATMQAGENVECNAVGFDLANTQLAMNANYLLQAVKADDENETVKLYPHNGMHLVLANNAEKQLIMGVRARG